MRADTEAVTITGQTTRYTGVDIDALVSESMCLARFLAVQYQGRGLDYDELESEAVVALWRAALKYDPRLGPFGQYARIRITHALSDLTGDAALSQVAGITVRLRRASRKCRAAAAELLCEGVDRPSVAEIAERTGLDPIVCRQAMTLPEVRADQRKMELLADVRTEATDPL